LYVLCVIEEKHNMEILKSIQIKELKLKNKYKYK
jgi:hypothetical protein